MRTLASMLALSLAALPAMAAQAPDWSYYPGFLGVGEAGLQVLDLDADGSQEVVVTGKADSIGANLLALLQREGNGMRVTHIRRLAPGARLVGTIVALPADPPLSERILAQVLEDDASRLVTFAGPALVPIAEVAVDREFLLYGAGDVDGDGAMDVYGTSRRDTGGFVGRPQFLDLASGAVTWTEPTRKAQLLGAGQIDSDPALEIVFSGDPFEFNGDRSGYVIDGATHAPEWTHADGFFGEVAFGNFDLDPSTREFATSGSGARTYVFRTTPSYAMIGNFPVEGARTLAYDFDDDGIDEILAGRWLDVVAFHPLDWSSVFEFDNPEQHVSALGLGQFDGDAAMEVVFGTGLQSTGADRLLVFDAATQSVQYDRADEVGPHSGLLVQDLDGDGDRELVFATRESNSGYDGVNLIVLDADTGAELRRRDNILFPISGQSVVQLRAANLDADPQLEIIAAGQLQFDGRVRVLDSSTLDAQWAYGIDDQSDNYGTVAVQAMELLHANGDAILDLAIAVDGRLYLVDGASGAQLWQSPSFDDVSGLTLAVGNLDADPALELSFGIAGSIHVFDAATRVLERSLVHGEEILGQAVEGSGDACRLVLYESMRLVRRRCSDLTQHSTRRYAATAVFVRPVTDSYGRLVLSDGHHLLLQRGGAVARSTPLGPSLGFHNGGTVIAVGEGARVFVGDEISVNSIELVDDGVELLYDGFE